MIYSLIPNLEANSLFSGVPKDYIEKHFNSDKLLVKDIPADTLAYSSKSSELQVAIIIKGAARVYAGHDGERALIRTLNAGDIFGIANLYDGEEPFPSQIVTATDSTLLFIGASDFKKFIEGNTVATRNYFTLLSKKIVFLNKKLATLTAGSAEKKLAAHIYEHQVDGVFTVSSLSELADILQMGRASLYRGIDTLINNQLIIKQSKTFIITDKENLKKYINKQ